MSGGAPMYVVELGESELRVVRQALEAYLEEFGHEEAETVRLIKAVMARVRTARAA